MRWSSRTSGKGPQGSIPRLDWETGTVLMTSTGEMHPTAKAWKRTRVPGEPLLHLAVWRQLGRDAEPAAGRACLDLGCGTGHLTAEIARAGSEVVGIDNSPDMVRIAKENFPDLVFHHADARDFHFPEGFDAVFSNAALHWIRRPSRSWTRLPVA